MDEHSGAAFGDHGLVELVPVGDAGVMGIPAVRALGCDLMT
jgi:hypothetical protein